MVFLLLSYLLNIQVKFKEETMKKRNILILVLALLLVTACGKNKEESLPLLEEEEILEEGLEKDLTSEYGVEILEDRVVFTDARGEEVSIEKNPKRVVCLYNSFLDIWDSAGGEVVGRVELTEDKPVEKARSAVEVGTAGSPSLEKVIELEPDLVIMTHGFSSQVNMIPALEENNIPFISLRNEYLEDYYHTVRLFTGILEREDLYEEIMAEVRDGVDDIVNKAPKDIEPKVLIMFASAKELTVRNSDSMVGEMLKDLNAINISDGEKDPSNAKIFSMEKIIEEDPDYIFVQTMGSDMDQVMERIEKDAKENPAWASLKAVKNGRYIVLPKDLYMYKPNRNYPQAYEGLGKILYPEVFGN